MGCANYLLSFIKGSEAKVYFSSLCELLVDLYLGSGGLINAQVNHFQAHLHNLRISTLPIKS